MLEKKWISGLFAALAALAAAEGCGSSTPAGGTGGTGGGMASTTSDGSTSTTGGTGGSAATGTGGAGGSGTGGASSSGTGVGGGDGGTTCPLQGNACNMCGATFCCAEASACFDDTSCTQGLDAWSTCDAMSGTTHAICKKQGDTAAGASASKFDAAIACLLAHCTTACGFK